MKNRIRDLREDADLTQKQVAQWYGNILQIFMA